MCGGNSVARLSAITVAACLLLEPSARAARLVLSCVLVVDVTASNVVDSGLQDLKDGVGWAIRSELKEDFVTVLAVADPITVAPPLKMGSLVKQADVDRALSLDSRSRHGGNPLWDGMLQAVRLLSSRTTGTAPIVIVYTAGETTANWSTSDDVSVEATKAGVEISAVFHTKREQVIPQKPSGVLLIPRRDLQLRQVVEHSAGVFSNLSATYGEAIKTALVRTLAEARRRLELSGVPR